MVHQRVLFGSIREIRKIWSLTANSRFLQADALKKCTLNKKCRLGSRVRVTVMSKAILSLNDGISTLHQKYRFGCQFRKTHCAPKMSSRK